MVASTKLKFINTKRLFTISLVAMLMVGILFPNSMNAGNNTTYTVSMRKQSRHNRGLDEEGFRTPPMPIYCVISRTDGVNIVGLSEDIISYEIWDSSHEINLASFSNESDFLDYLLIQTGSFQLNLETENYNVFGYISLD